MLCCLWCVKSLQQSVRTAKRRVEKACVTWPRIPSPLNDTSVMTVVDLDQMCFPLEERQPINIFGKTNQFFQGNHRTLALTRWREGSASARVGNCSLELVLLMKISV